MNWNEEEHSNFYNSLHKLEPADQSDTILNRARDLLKKSKTPDDLKAVESLLTYWKLNLRFEKDLQRADALLYHLYQRMGDPKRAVKFRPLGH